MWFGIDDDWIGPATETTTGWGYVRADLPVTDGVAASRTDVVPDGVSGVLVGLSLRSDTRQTITLARGRPFGAAGLLPVGGDQPEPDPRSTCPTRPMSADQHLVFTDRGTPPTSEQRVAQLGRGGRHQPRPGPRSRPATNFRGPQDPR